MTLSLDLPLPVNNGPGAAVDVSALGGPITITCVGQLAGANLTIEVSNDGGATYSPLCTFQSVGGVKVVPVAAQWMRTNVSGRGSKPFLVFSANVDVGGPGSGSTFATLPMPVLNGAGAAVDVSAFDLFCTFVCTGTFLGASIQVQISEDNVDWSTLLAFNGRGGIVSRLVSAAWVRAFVVGREAGQPFTGVLAVGSTELGGGASVGISVEDEGAPVAGGPFSAFNFIGAGVTATDGGGGTADVTIPGGGGGGGTDGGEAGLVGAGTALDPLIPVAGPFRPIDQVTVFDDYMTYYPLTVAGEVIAVGSTSVMKTAGATAVFSINDAAGPLGPGAGSMMGVMDLQLVAAPPGDFITATQFRDGNDSGQCINLDRLEGNWDLWMAARVSFEGLLDFETNQLAFIGFRAQIDLSVIGVQEGAWFHPRDNGVQVNWFAFYRIADDSGIVTADVDTGVRVGFTAAHPADARAAQNLIVRITGPDAAAELNMYIDGVLVVGPIALVNPVSVVTPMQALAPVPGAPNQSNTLYVDWVMWHLTGRTI